MNKITLAALLAVAGLCHAREKEGYTGAAPSGLFVAGNSDKDMTNIPFDQKKMEVSSFFTDRTEITNTQYRQFVNWLKDSLKTDNVDELTYSFEYFDYRMAIENRHNPGADKNSFIVKDSVGIYPDTLVWMVDFPGSETTFLVTDYFSSGRYDDYPVVGVSWKEAKACCAWYTELYNSYNGKHRKGEEYNGGDTQGRKRTMGMEDGLLTQPHRLPTEAEWEYAAVSLMANNEGYLTRRKIDIRSKNKRTKGLIMMNYKQGKGNNMGTAGYLNEGADITAPVKSYGPNAFGLYNVLGNTNEWVADVYKENTYAPDGDLSPAVVFSNEPDLAGVTGSLKPGFEEFMALDGNSEVLDGEYQAVAVQDSTDEKLYGISTPASNQSRVIKGGFWNDRIQWVNPSARRYMDRKTSSAMIGFRCAMTMTGSPEVISNNMKRASKKHFRAKGRRK